MVNRFGVIVQMIQYLLIAASTLFIHSQEVPKFACRTGCTVAILR